VSYSTSRNEANIFLKERGYKVYQVNEKQFNTKLAKCKGVRTASEVYKEIYDTEYEQWVEEGKKYLIGLIHYHVSINAIAIVITIVAELKR